MVAMATIDKSSRDRDGSFSNVIDPRRISVLSVTNGPEPPKSGAEKLRDFFYPDWSIADAKNPRFWKDLLIEFICCTYFITLVDWVLVSNYIVSRLSRLKWHGQLDAVKFNLI